MRASGEALRVAAGGGLLLISIAAALASATLAATRERAALEAFVHADGEEPAITEQVHRLLRDATLKGDRLSAALAALGPDSIAPQLDVLRDELLPSAEQKLDLRLAPAIRQAILTALIRLGPTDVVVRLRERLASSADPLERRVAIEVLGSVGRAEDLELLMELAVPPGEEASFDVRIAAAAERSLQQIFDREPAALEAGGRLLPRAHVEVAPALALALGSSTSQAGFDVLAVNLGLRPDLDRVVLPNLARSAAAFTSPRRENALALVRADVASADPMLARAAAAACGDLSDARSAPHLCELLEHADRELALEAHRSLAKLSGLGFPPQRERWELWLESEDSWLESSAPALLEQLDDEDPEIALASLETLAQHPLHRESLAPAVAEVARFGGPVLGARACAVLGRLGWAGSIPVLRELSSSATPELASAAPEALRILESRLRSSR